jgi:serine/threonine protein kinase
VAAGTPFYVAPELKDSDRLVCASDTFSFGVILWEVFMGQPPYVISQDGAAVQHPDFPTFPSHCPFNYAVLALACMAPVPADRPPFFQVFEVLTSLDVELSNGLYVDWAGKTRVRPVARVLPACFVALH